MKLASSPKPSTQSVAILRETPDDGEEVEQLLDLCFGGPARLARPVYTLRKGVVPVRSLCFVVRIEGGAGGGEGRGRLAAVLRFWSVRVVSSKTKHSKSKSSSRKPLLLFGPLSVDPALQGQGFGKRLTAHGIKAARAIGGEGIIISCVPAYYRPFGFREACMRGLDMPRPSPGHAVMGLEFRANSICSLKGRVVPDTAP